MFSKKTLFLLVSLANCMGIDHVHAQQGAIPSMAHLEVDSIVEQRGYPVPASSSSGVDIPIIHRDDFSCAGRKFKRVKGEDGNWSLVGFRQAPPFNCGDGIDRLIWKRRHVLDNLENSKIEIIESNYKKDCFLPNGELKENTEHIHNSYYYPDGPGHYYYMIEIDYVGYQVLEGNSMGWSTWRRPTSVGEKWFSRCSLSPDLAIQKIVSGEVDYEASLVEIKQSSQEGISLENLLVRLNEKANKIYGLNETSTAQRNEIDSLEKANQKLEADWERLLSELKREVEESCQAIDERPFEKRPSACDGVPISLDNSLPSIDLDDVIRSAPAKAKDFALDLIEFGLQLAGNTVTIVRNAGDISELAIELEDIKERYQINQAQIEANEESIPRLEESMKLDAREAYNDYISVVKNSSVISEYEDGYYSELTKRPFTPESLMFAMVSDIKERIEALDSRN